MVSMWLGGWIWRPNAAAAVLPKKSASMNPTPYIQIFSYRSTFTASPGRGP